MPLLEKTCRAIGAIVIALIMCHEAYQPLRDMLSDLGLHRVFTAQWATAMAEFAPLALTPAIYQWLGKRGGAKP